MSDVDGRLEATRKALLKNSIFFCVGWLLFMLYLFGGGVFSSAFMLIGWGIIGGPKIWLAMLGDFGAALKPDYEVVTTYGDGRRESDGGTQSVQMNFLARLVVIAVLYVIGGILTIITLVFLTIKYIVLHIATSPKPAFIKSGLFIIVMNIAVIFGSIVLAFIIQGVNNTVRDAANAAAVGRKTSGDFQYRLNEAKDGIVLEEYLGKKGGAIVIPATFDGKPVVGIDGAFIESGDKGWGKNNRSNRITSVSIPDTVTFISDSAFSKCADLKQITLPKNLKFIQYNVFSESGLTSITIPEEVTDIGNYAFQKCANLTSVTLPRSLARVGGSAFENCTSLTDVTIPSDRTIKYGHYSSIVIGGSQYTTVADMGSLNQFVADEDYLGSSDMDHKKAFKGCTKLSASSRQAITDSGYIGAF